MKKDKKITSRKQPKNKKPIRQKSEIDYTSQKVLLNFSLIDHNAERWGFQRLDNPQYRDLIKKLSDFCSMTWQNILYASGGKSKGHGNNNHLCKVSKFCEDAKKRLEKLHMEDVDSLFSLRLSGKVRIYGVRENNIFKPIWYDQYHGDKRGVYQQSLCI